MNHENFHLISLNSRNSLRLSEILFINENCGQNQITGKIYDELNQQAIFVENLVLQNL